MSGTSQSSWNEGRGEAAERLLTSPPRLGPLFARAGAGALPLPSVPGLQGVPGLAPRAHDLPATVLRLEDVAVDRERLARYSRVCGFPLRDRLPATFPHVLAFPLQLLLMTEPSFPFPAIGLVHIANRVTQHRPLGVGEPLSLRVWAENLRAHPRGRQFSLRTEVRIAGELVWEEESVNLRRGGGGGGDEAGREPRAGAEEPSAGDRRSASEEAIEAPARAVWRLPADLGRRYGAVAGDLNPIHLHPLTARLFGFPRPIAHGLWTKARCLAALDSELGDRLEVAVEFGRPMPLPGEVELAVAGERFAVRGAARPEARRPPVHLTGRLSSA